MARQLRIEFEGALYHLTDRGLGRSKIFLDKRDYEKFLQYLPRAIEQYNLIVDGFCLIPNHYHIECETPQANLSKAMQWLNTSYAAYFNRRHERTGHLFDGRYKAVLVQKEKHLLELTRYIHLNPVRAKLVSRPEDYAWSSYRTYLGIDRRFPWVTTDWTLTQFGKTSRRAIKAYQKFVEEGMTRGVEDPTKEAVGGVVLGDESFVESIEDRFIKDKPLDPEQPSLRALRGFVSVDCVLDSVCVAFHSDRAEVARRGRQGNTAHDMAVYLCRQHCGLSNSELGRVFGDVVESTISHACQRAEAELRNSPSTRRLVSQIENSIFKV